MSDGREHQRFPLKLEVEYRTRAAFLVAYSLNLSKGGLFLETTDHLPPGTRLTLRFVLPGFMPTIDAEVAWVRTAEEGMPGLGIRFLDPASDQLGAVIDSLVVGFHGLAVLVFAAGQPSRAQISRMLKSIMSSASVAEAANPRQAEKFFTRGGDLAIIDLDGAGGAGITVLRAAKLRPGGPLPVVAIAADDRQRAQAAELDADRILGSPPPFPEFHDAVVGVLAKPSRVG